MRHLLLVVCLALTTSSLASSLEIHVAVNGDDKHQGTEKHPVASLQRAQELVRNYLSRENRAVDVIIHPGIYELDVPLKLGAEDSGKEEAPITWRAANPKKRPVLSAGSKILGEWKLSDRPGVWCIDIPQAKNTENGSGWNFRQLFVDGERAVRARYPNIDAENPFIYATNSKPGDKGVRSHIVIDPSLIKDGWLKEDDIQINLVVDWLFFNQWNTVSSIEESEGKIHLSKSERHGRIFKNNWFYIEGIMAELDQPGEWYLDRKIGRLHYMPELGRNPNKMTFYAPRLDRIIDVRGDVNKQTHVRHIHFQDLEFRHTAFNLGHIAPRVHTDAAIRFENTRHSSVRNCHFHNIGGYAFWLHLDSQHNRFSHNSVIDSGGGGVLMTGSRLSYMDDSRVYTPGEAASKVAPILNKVTHNTVERCGRIRYYGGGVHIDSRPVNMALMPGNYIAHNHFRDLSRNGIFAFRNQGGNVIEFNHIYDAMQTTIDGACVHIANMNYLCAPNYIMNNWLHDIWGYRYLPDRNPRRTLANGVFLDWETSDSVVKNNYVYNSAGEAIKQVWNNRNNIIEHNFNSTKPITPPFADELGPKGKATNGIALEDIGRTGGVVHYKNHELIKRSGGWKAETIGGLNKLLSYEVLKADPETPSHIEYSLPVTEDGTYEVSIFYKPEKTNASNATIKVHHSGGVDKKTWNMQKGHKHGFAVNVGSYEFKKDKPAKVTISNESANGTVIADSVGFVRVSGK